MSSIPELAKSLSSPERNVLPYLSKHTNLFELLRKSGLSDAEIKRGLMWLENRGVLTTQETSVTQWELGHNGKLAKKYGMPELRIARQLAQGPKTIDELCFETLPKGEILSNMGILKQLGLVELEKKDGELYLVPTGKQIESQNYPPTEVLANEFPVSQFTSSQEDVVKKLQKRKDFIKKNIVRGIDVMLTPLGIQLIDSNIDLDGIEEQLTDTMLKDGGWKNKTFRTYDVQARVPPIDGGRRHPYKEAANIIRDVYLAMGFTEMKGPWVETAFWCMDAMWIPQDHPARDEQDTFFVEGSGDIPEAFVDIVKAVHENGADTGSKGHGTPWNAAIAKQLILRTHSTATTFRQFGQGIKEGKYFSIANVFRNEAVDATHLAEFLQAEGFVIGDNLTLADLMGFIKEFYARLGIHTIRFKPTYNPYTEPSIEAHYFDETKKKWYSLINSGIFRPESLRPFGINKTVMAWGMGASRVASILNNKQNLRELVGPQVDVRWIAQHKTPRLEDNSW